MDLARNWRLKDQRYRLEGAVCATCGAKFFPPRGVCAECRSNKLEPFKFSGRGELYSFTTLYQAPLGYEGGLPYAVGMIKLDEGPMIEAQLTDVNPQDLKIGQRVEMVTRKLRELGEEGLIVYGYKFRPVANAS
ncbi:MAG: Zn-ribbon domain-containing OB-fold protein [Chloroflexi bacterium]|nr:Zn-ribbon domain-containing OB-fold protein [Chloroflexota bacterium]